MVGALERDEATWMAGGAEDLARVGDADRVVGGRVHDKQRPAQGADLLAEIGGADVFDEMPLERERLTADENGASPSASIRATRAS